MAPPANPSASGAPTGCFKCGRPGHWSRDCPSSSSSSPTAPASNLPNKTSSASASGSWKPSATSSSWKSGKPALKPPPAKPSLPRKRPKLTPDLLLSNEGLGYVLEHFPRMVKIQGPGHEVDDLKNFLEAYVHWHSRILPYFSFNQFVEKVAKVGSTKRVRICVNDLKNKVARGDELKLTLEEKNTDWTQGDKDLSLDNHHDFSEHLKEDYDEVPPADINEDVFDEFYTKAVDASDSVIELEPMGISEDQKVRMEANRLKAIERAKARAAAPAVAT